MDIENEAREAPKILATYRGMGRPITPAPVLCATSGKASTWLPLGGLVEQAQRKITIAKPIDQLRHNHMTDISHKSMKIVICTMSRKSQRLLAGHRGCILSMSYDSTILPE